MKQETGQTFPWSATGIPRKTSLTHREGGFNYLVKPLSMNSKKNDILELKWLYLAVFRVLGRMCNEASQVGFRVLSDSELSKDYFCRNRWIKQSQVHEVISHLHYTSLRLCHNLFPVHNAYYFLFTILQPVIHYTARTVRVIFLSSKITDPKKLFPTRKLYILLSENFWGRDLLKSIIIN